MSRLVRFPSSESNSDIPLSGYDGELFDAPAQPVAAADSYLERVAKYVPAEVFAIFVFINAILDQTIKNGGPTTTMAHIPATQIAVGALIGATIMSPVFVWYMRREGDAWVTHALVSFLALPFWAYAIGAVAFGDYRDGSLAAILLAVFTLASGLVSPRMPKADQRGKAAAPLDGPRLVETMPGVSA